MDDAVTDRSLLGQIVWAIRPLSPVWAIRPRQGIAPVRHSTRLSIPTCTELAPQPTRPSFDTRLYLRVGVKFYPWLDAFVPSVVQHHLYERNFLAGPVWHCSLDFRTSGHGDPRLGSLQPRSSIV